MRVLFIWPPEKIFTGSLFKHYTYFGETIGYFSKQKKYHIDVLDCGVKQYSYSELYNAVQADVVIIYVETYTIKSAVDLAEFCKASNRKVTVIAYGSACCYIPKFFAKNENIDVVVYNANWEQGIDLYLNYINGNITIDKLKNIYFSNGKEILMCQKGDFFEPQDWGVPDLDLLPIQDYFKVRGKKQIELAVNKGCGYNCKFCSEKVLYGHKDYRRDVNSIINFIKNITIDYDTIYFDSTTFTYNRDWVIKLCNQLIKENMTIRWRTVTRIDALDEELVSIMASAGCYKISFGVETLNEELQAGVYKKIELNNIIKAFNLVKKYNIIPRALIILGLPGQSGNDFKETYETLKKLECEIRVKEYIPYNEILNDDKINDIVIKRLDRSRFYYQDMEGLSPEQYMKYLYDNGDA